MMDEKQKKKLVDLAGDSLKFDRPMAPYTTFGVGGPVDALYEARSLKELCNVVVFLNLENIPYLVTGLGSNLLVKDDGLEGVAILLRGSLAVIEKENAELLAGAGLSITDLLTYCRESGLGGLEFLAGIPGTVGGAVAMNAGAFGNEIEARIKEIHLITAKGDVAVRDRSQLNFSYRTLDIEKENVIFRALLKVTREAEGIVTGRIADYLKRRKKEQPLEYPSAGSVFKNPPNDYAGRLIENAGMKGKRVGGAMISEKHGNYIVNTGGASAADILALMHMVRDTVRKETGIELQQEIRVIGR